MSLLKNLQIDASKVQDNDVLGGGRQLLKSDVYDFEIKLAYLSKAKNSKAMAANLLLVTPSGAEHKEQIWFTNKEGGAMYPDKKTGEMKALPGFATLNSMSLLSIGKTFNSLDTEKKTIKLYNYDAKAEVATDVDMIMALIGAKIKAGILLRKENKTKLNESTGVYENIADARESNVIDKFFRAKDNMTEAEIRAKLTTPVFITEWLAKWKDQVDDRYKAVGNRGNSGAPAGNFVGAGKAPDGTTDQPDNMFL